MPTYGYRYTDTEGGEFDEFQHIHEDAFTVKDGRPCERTVAAFKPQTRYGKGNTCEPIEMMSIALDNEDEIQEFRARNPGVEISSDRADRNFGVPIAHSRSQKKAILDKEGFVDTKSFG